MSKKKELLAAAESRVRNGGYANFSFRELANEVGIKSASVHYHFPTKEDLGAELAQQYTDNFLESLGDPSALLQQNKNPIEVYIAHFRHALLVDKQMCLCGLLGAESDALPEKVKHETTRFFERNIAWLEQAYASLNMNGDDNRLTNIAVTTLALLEGALMISKTLDNIDVFEHATISIKRLMHQG
jgi:TetR/AcrR family transcriptional repressor of nem operon